MEELKLKEQSEKKEKLTMGLPNKIELSPWKTPLDYRENLVKLPKISKIDKWD